MADWDDAFRIAIARREFLRTGGLAVGSIALASLLADESQGAAGRRDLGALVARAPHFPAKAKRLIYLHMVGGPSQLDLFDDKQVLRAQDGSPCPPELIRNDRFAFPEENPTLFCSRFRFAKHGGSGTEMSELLPHLATVAD